VGVDGLEGSLRERQVEFVEPGVEESPVLGGKRWKIIDARRERLS
jgi:hypothetical protein